ncbi:TPA: hypothetical protein HA243_03325 [Candidatus Micrarchaeota archaeon]|nr:hypothetical protein [Candidatus Micrarchaeota archaeon]
MRCFGRHLSTLLLFCSIAFSATFDECFPRNELYSFWNSPLYVSQNTHILNLGIASFYFFEFDAASEGLNLTGVAMTSGSEFLSALPPGERKDFSDIASSLNSAANSSSSARESYQKAHLLSKNAQGALSTLLSPYELSLLMAPASGQPASFATILLPLWHAYDLALYGSNYPSYLWQAHQSAASAFDSANFAQNELAKRCDERHLFLKRAGAGAAEYNGKARQAYSRAQSALLSSSSRCSAKGAQEISDYFASSPQVPNVAEAGLAEYLDNALGNGRNTSIIFLAETYSGLSQAALQMQQEFDQDLFSAKGSAEKLSGELSLLEKEKLELIGEQPAQSGGQYALIGSGFSGILSGFRKAKEELAASKQLIYESESLSKSERVEGYLASAISKAEQSGKRSESALLSLPEIRANANDAVAMQRELSQAAMEKARQKLTQSPGSFSDAQSLEEARSLFDSAEEAFSSAEAQGSLGERFMRYTDALKLAVTSSSRADSRFFLPLKSGAEQSLYSLESLLQSAQKDGLEVHYEQSRLQSYRQLLRSSSSSETFQVISDATAQDYKSVLLRLSQSYSPLNEKYAETAYNLEEIRKSEPAFLPAFDPLSQYFPGGILSPELAAGKLSTIKKDLDSLYAQSQVRLPAHLSALLSESTVVQEISDPPMLGQPSRYSAAITAKNPTGLAYSGSLLIKALTSLPLYSPDFISGDRVLDAYFKDGKTNIAIAGVEPYQGFSFSASKTESPVSVASSNDECEIAFSQGALVKRKIAFFATRNLESLGVSELVPEGTQNGIASYSGRQYALYPSFSDGSNALVGEISKVTEGKNTVEILYEVGKPFEVAASSQILENMGGGTTKVSYEVILSNPGLDCDSAAIAIDEPYSAVSHFSATSLDQGKVTGAASVPTSFGTRLSFLVSPLRKGKSIQASVSYTILDVSAAVSSALALAEAQVVEFKRQRDIYSLAQAKSLLAENRTTEALALLSQMRSEAEGLVLSSADYRQFLEENQSASALLSDSLQATTSLLEQNLTEQSARLSLSISALQDALQSASLLFQDGKYGDAVKQARKAASNFRSSLSELAWDSSSEVSSHYAKARKEAAPKDAHLSAAESLIASANSLYSQGKHLQSYLLSSRASGEIAASSQLSLSGEEEANQALKIITEDFESLRAKGEKSLSQYSQQFSALSGQSKKRLPITPSSAQQKIDDAAKGLATASKSTLPNEESLAQATRSYAKLAEAVSAIEDSLGSIRLSAASSLEVAKVALSEVNAKASPEEKGQASQIESEVKSAEAYYSGSLYADSLMASERAISASNALLSRKEGGIDAGTAALGALSLLFIAAAAYYFAKRKKPEEKKKGKKSIPKGEEI